MKECAVSAPGKILLAGGYLVLDRAHTGLVVSIDARIHTHVQPLPTSEGVVINEIVVRSPQFECANWRYGYHYVGTEQGSGVIITELKSGYPSESQSKNLFVETALTYAFTYIVAVTKSSSINPSIVTILADNEYYSAPSSTASLTSHPVSEPVSRFARFPTTLELTHKTGLGSSAALVTSLIGAILSHYLPSSIYSLSKNKIQLHRLAQAAHCAAQGKVGSGFDVASAVFGSCIYKRFSPAVLTSLGDMSGNGFASRLQTLVDGDGVWDEKIDKGAIKMPSNLRLVLVDVDVGSKTPGMVKQVLKWRESNAEEAEEIWGNLQKENDAFAAELVRLAEAESCNDFGNLGKIISDIRVLIREMSSKAEVPIEPEAQTRLLDACTEVNGVVGGVTPGAGGYDAIALLVEDKMEVLVSLQKLLERWKFDLPNGGSGNVRFLDVREEMRGILEEEPVQYQGWTA